MSNQHDPWGQRSGDGPPDLFKLIKNLFSSSKGKRNSQSSGGAPVPAKFLMLIPIAAVGIWFATGFFVVNAQEQAVITRFGRYVETLNPGLHWIPRLVEKDKVMNVQRIRIHSYNASMLTVDTDTLVDPTHQVSKKIQSTLGNTSKGSVQPVNAALDQDEGANDISIVQAEIKVNYRIANPSAFLFNTSDPINTLQKATSSALRQEVGHMQLEAVLSTKRELLRQNVAKQLRQILAAYNTGIEITDVTIQKTETPEEVRPAFLDVIKAQGELNTFVNIAEAYAAQQLQTAQGQSSKLLANANAYKSKVVNDAKGKVSRYDALLFAYNGAPQMTRDRLYYDAMQDVLGHTTNVVLSNKGNNLIYLPLEQLMKRHSESAAASEDSSEESSSLIHASTSGSVDEDASTADASSNRIYGAPRASSAYQ